MSGPSLAREDLDRFVALLSRADQGPLDRGERLVGTGAVTFGEVEERNVNAIVKGTDRYAVRLNTTNLVWSCSCPAAADGSFCKHCVVVVHELVRAQNADANKDAPPTDRQRIEAYLNDRPASELVALLLDQSDYDDQLASGLLAKAMAANGEKIDLREWKKRVTKAFRGQGGFIDWRRASEWARGVHDMLDVLQALLGAGHVTEVAALVEHAHKRCESAMQRVDDSGGEIIGIVSVLADLHVQACELGAYPPKKLGKRLADLELAAELDTFSRSADRYAHILGADGLAAYIAAVDKAAEKLGRPTSRWSGPHWRIDTARRAHAVATEDPDLLIEICTADPDDEPSITDFNEIIDLLKQAGRHDEAFDWADHGLATHQSNSHYIGPLRERWAALAMDRSGGADAVEDLYWAEYIHRPTAASLADLRSKSRDEEAAVKRAVEWVDDMVREVRARGVAFEQDDRSPPRGSQTAERGTVGAPTAVRAWREDGALYDSGSAIEVLFDVGDIDQAWSLAMEFGAGTGMWERLVSLRREDHPEDSIAWAFEKAEMEIDHRDRKRYRRAAKLLSAERDSINGDNSLELLKLFASKLTPLMRKHDNKPSLLDEFWKAQLIIP